MSSQGGAVDAHVHVWEAGTRGHGSFADATAPALLRQMNKAGVAHAIVLQPRRYGSDHSYLDWALNTYPSRFSGVCFIDIQSVDAVEALRRLLSSTRYCGVRIDLSAGRNSTGDYPLQLDAALSVVAEFGNAVVSFLLDPPQLSIATRAASRHPHLFFIVDHIGRCSVSVWDYHVSELANLSGLPNVLIKVSALNWLSEQGYPFDDLKGLLAFCHRSFGSARLLWGTDFPYILEACDYCNALSSLSRLLPELSATDMEDVVGGNATRVYGLPSDSAPQAGLSSSIDAKWKNAHGLE